MAIRYLFVVKPKGKGHKKIMIADEIVRKKQEGPPPLRNGRRRVEKVASKQEGIHLLLSTIITLINKRLVTTRGGDARICVRNTSNPLSGGEKLLCESQSFPEDSTVEITCRETKQIGLLSCLISNEVEVSPSSSGLSTFRLLFT